MLSQLLDNTAVSQTTQTLDDVNLKATGTLFQLPRGQFETAFGVEYRHQGLNQYAVANSASGPSVTNSGIFSAAFGRSVYAAYAEFLVPLISEDAHVRWSKNSMSICRDAMTITAISAAPRIPARR